ncbi:MAG: TBC domain-containing protein [archaeon]|nr:TBC domain-containing protein [archaeon]
MDKYLTNYYWEKDFFSLQSSLSLITILLRYHDPELNNLLEYTLIKPEMYATSWILTIFANKCYSLGLILELWDKLILFNDPLFLHFFIVALLMKQRNKIIESDMSSIPSVVCKVAIENIDQVDELIGDAIDLSNKTPYSFRLLAKNLNIFSYHSTKIQELYYFYALDNMLAMPIFPSEVMGISYKHFFHCVDSDCPNFSEQDKKSSFFGSNKSQTVDECFNCKNSKMFEPLSYIILDLRILDTSKKKANNISTGYLPQTVEVDANEILSKSFPSNVIEKYKIDKGNFHFLLITSETEYFTDYESKFYVEEELNEERNRQFNLGMITKSNKELSLQKVNSELEDDLESGVMKMQLKEFDNFKKAIMFMVKEKFPYVSYIYGGFHEVHTFAMKYKMDLLGHKKECYICAKERNSGFFNSLKTFGKKIKKRYLTDLPFNTQPEETKKEEKKEEPKFEFKQIITIDDIDIIFQSNSVIKYFGQNREDIDELELGAVGGKASLNNISSTEVYYKKAMVFLTGTSLLLYQESTEDSFMKLNEIPISSVVKVSPKNQAGNIMTIFFTVNNYRLQRTVDFLSDIDANDFRNKLLKIKYKKLFTE